MKTVRMRTTSAGPKGTRLAGRAYRVEEGEAADLIAGGYATAIDVSNTLQSAVAEPAPERAVEPTVKDSEPRVNASAAAIGLASASDIDLAEVEGSGVDGKVTVTDVRRVMKEREE